MPSQIERTIFTSAKEAFEKSPRTLEDARKFVSAKNKWQKLILSEQRKSMMKKAGAVQFTKREKLIDNLGKEIQRVASGLLKRPSNKEADLILKRIKYLKKQQGILSHGKIRNI